MSTRCSVCGAAVSKRRETIVGVVGLLAGCTLGTIVVQYFRMLGHLRAFSTPEKCVLVALLFYFAALLYWQRRINRR